MPAGDMTRIEKVDDDFIPADARPVWMKFFITDKCFLTK
jgi:hypothetical protein